MQTNRQKIAVIGAGSWGTALALLLSRKGLEVQLWGHKREHVQALLHDRENKKYLSGFLFPDSLRITSELQEAVNGAGCICMVVPSHGFRDVYRNIAAMLEEDVTIVSAVKGIENDTLMTMSQVIDDTHRLLANKSRYHTAVLSGPSFAKEVAQSLPTAITIGCKDIEVAEHLQNIFVTDYFRVYASTDVVGLEISGALKNIVAIAAGICDGLGYGLNTRAALITRGLAEITRFGVALGAQQQTFYGLSGIGDLMLTCTGDLSRNRSVGLKLGEGKSLREIISEMEMVAEGVKTTRSVYELASKMKIEMPILEQVYAILYDDKQCSDAVSDLLKRELKIE